jgi:hypothetical protein
MAKETPGASRFEPLSVLWHVFAAPQTLLVLLALIVLVLATGSLIPQIPSQAMSDPRAWLALHTGLFGQGGDLVRTLGLFDVYRSFGFRLLLILTGLCLFVRLAESAEVAWRVIGRKPWTPQALVSWGNRPPQIWLSSTLSPDEVRARLDRFLGERHAWWKEVSGPSGPSLVAGGRRPVLWARVLGYGALLLALAGLAVEGNWGWQGERWQPILGESRALGHGTPYSIRLDAFEMHMGDDPRLQEYPSQVTWLEGDVELERAAVGVGHPTTRGGVAVRQLGYVPLVRMRGWDSEGRSLILETEEDMLSVTGEAEIRFGAPEAQPVVLISDHDLFLTLTFEPRCAEGRPALHLERIDTGGTEREEVGLLYESGTVSLDSLQLEVDLSLVPILRADHHPALGLVVAGIALAVLALVVTWLFPPWLVWVTAGQGEEDRTWVQILALPGPGNYRWLPPMADRLREVLVDDA